MCEAKPGPRCFSDSSITLTNAKARLEKEKASHAAVVAKADDAMTQFDFASYASAQEKAEERLARVREARVEKRHVLRDVDGTKTGSRLLDSKMENTADEAEYAHLMRRRRSANMLRPIRKHALSHKSGEVTRPAFALPGEHIGDRVFAAAA